MRNTNAKMNRAVQRRTALDPSALRTVSSSLSDTNSASIPTIFGNRPVTSSSIVAGSKVRLCEWRELERDTSFENTEAAIGCMGAGLVAHEVMSVRT